MDQGQALLQTLSQVPVGGTRVGFAGWMVVRDNDSGGVVVQTGLDDFPGIHRGRVDGAPKEFFMVNRAMALIEKEAGKNFCGFISQPVDKEVTGIFGPRQGIAAPQGFMEVAPGQLQRRLKLGVVGRADPFTGQQPVLGSVEQVA